MQGTEPSLDTRVRLVSRFALFFATFSVIFVFVAFSYGSADSSIEAFQSQAQVVAGPGYRAFATLDSLVWIFGAGMTWLLSVMVEPFALMRSRLAALCGVAQLVGALGGFTRLFAVSDLATRYVAAAPDQQRIILGMFQTVANNFNAMFILGNFFTSAGFLLVGSALLGRHLFPRWLAVWTTLAGVTAGLTVLRGIVIPFASPVFQSSFPIVLVHIFVASGLTFALAVRLWRFKAGAASPT
ncbi:MAG: DUF4386 domain-containing protein [Nitrososphaerales archaeon]|nr:DUF4386 domain-containing protein [Nitrososphaerales archaeon]